MTSRLIIPKRLSHNHAKKIIDEFLDLTPENRREELERALLLTKLAPDQRYADFCNGVVDAISEELRNDRLLVECDCKVVSLCEAAYPA